MLQPEEFDPRDSEQDDLLDDLQAILEQVDALAETLRQQRPPPAPFPRADFENAVFG